MTPRRALLLLLLSAAVPGALPGCAAYVDYRVYSEDQMGALKTNLGVARKTIDDVVHTLDEVAGQQVSRAVASHYFLNTVTVAVQQANQIRGMREDLEAREAAFMADWALHLETLTDEAQRSAGEAQRDAAIERFDMLEVRMDEARALFEPWMLAVLQARAKLNHDPKLQTDKSLEQLAAEVRTGAGPLKASIQRMQDALSANIREIAAASPPDLTLRY